MGWFVISFDLMFNRNSAKMINHMVTLGKVMVLGKKVLHKLDYSNIFQKFLDRGRVTIALHHQQFAKIRELGRTLAEVKCWH